MTIVVPHRECTFVAVALLSAKSLALTQGRCQSLSLHELAYQCRNFIGFGTECEVACVEYVDLCGWYVLAAAFRLAVAV